MRPNLELLKLIIRILILLIMFVMLFIISAFLYSAKYWPDVYNYINANITIKRIPTISELHPVIVYENEFTTELYSTTDASDYFEATTDDDDFNLNFDDFMNDVSDDKRRKRQIPVEEMKINIEIIKANYDYVFDFDITTESFVKDLAHVDELTTTDPKYFEMITKTDDCVKESKENTAEKSTSVKKIKPTDGVDSVYPWIATVFVMNPDSKQFEYICDGSLLSERVVLTAARCVLKNNVTVDAANMLIILGKRSLQSTGPNEKVLRVKSIKIHNNFVSIEGKVDNDLAITVLAEPAVFNVDIQPAPLGIEEKSAPLATATTGWHMSGPLQPLYLAQSTENSRMGVNCNDHICSILGDSETTCPSYGGLFIERQDDDQWRLKGIASGSPTNTGVCFNKHLTFTKIGNYLDWIKKNIQETSSK